MQPENKFFAELGRLAGSKQRENQVSRTFAASFNESQAFRRIMLGVFWRALRRGANPPHRTPWGCRAEVAPPKADGGRVDLCISPLTSSGSSRRAFYVESKVDAALTKRQVKKYLKSGARPLIVMTKEKPDDPVDDEEVAYVRWQDVHRALQETSGAGAVDRRVCRWMAEYLEELGMAYREDLSLTDVESCGKLFRRIATRKQGWSQMASREVFEVVHNCAGLLTELQRDFLARHSMLAGAPYIRGETIYGKWNDEGSKSISHHLGWGIRKSPWAKWNFLCAICWENEPDRAAYLYLLLDGSTVKRHESGPELKKFLSKSTGRLDRAKLLQHLEKCARTWGVV